MNHTRTAAADVEAGNSKSTTSKTSMVKDGGLSLVGIKKDRPEPTHLRARTALLAMSAISSARGFFYHLTFLVLFCMINWVRFDTKFAHETLTIYKRALSYNDLPTYESFERDDHLVLFLEFEVPAIITYVKKSCPTCRVALSTKSTDMANQDSADFMCSDWKVGLSEVDESGDESDRDNNGNRKLAEDVDEYGFEIGYNMSTTGGSEKYPLRDCDFLNARWAANPTARLSPCCNNKTLVLASMALGAHYRQFGEMTLPLNQIDSEESMTVVAAMHSYVTKHVKNDGFLLQMIISRDGRMVGILYKAYQPDIFQPRYVKTSKTFWTYNYVEEWTDAGVNLLAWAMWTISLVHEVFEVWSSTPSIRDAFVFVLTSPFYMCVEIPSFILPTLCAAYGRTMDVQDLMLCVVFTTLVMFVRTFQEAGSVLPPVALIVKTLVHASGQTLGFTLVLVTIMFMLSYVQMLTFGVFLDDFKDMLHAMQKQFDVMQEGSSIGDTLRHHAPYTAEIFYYMTSFILYLIMSQFLIAILVGAFDETRRYIEDTKRANFARTQLVGADKTPPPLPHLYALGMAYAFATARNPGGGGWQYQAMRQLREQLGDFDAEKEDDKNLVYDDPDAEAFDANLSGATLIPKANVEATLGQRSSAGLLEWYGAIVHPTPKTDTESNSPPWALTKRMISGNAESDLGDESVQGAKAASHGTKTRRRKKAEEELKETAALTQQVKLLTEQSQRIEAFLTGMAASRPPDAAAAAAAAAAAQPWVALESAVAALQTSNAVVAALETSNGKGPHEPSTRTRRTLERETYKGPRGSSKRRSATPSKRQDTYMDFTAVETQLANSAEAQ